MADTSGEGGRGQSTDALLAAESRHRLSNTLQLLLAVVAQRRRQVTAVEAKHQLRWMENVIEALVILQRSLGTAGPHGGLSLYLEHLPELWRPICTVKLIDMTVETEPVGIAQAKQLPLALAAHELTTNAIRHAFPNRGGRIRIALKAAGESAAELTVADDGVGLPAPADRSGAGLPLVENLAASFGGALRLESRHGTSARVRFPIP